MADTVVDACCLINLLAIGDLSHWLPALGMTWHVPTATLSEAMFLRGVDATGNPTKERVSPGALVDAGVLKLCELIGGDETGLYIELAVDLDDGEAMAMAIAKTRGWLLATDDRKARRLANRIGVELLATPQLVRLWAERTQRNDDDIAITLNRIEAKARFIPPQDSPDSAWWHEHLRR